MQWLKKPFVRMYLFGTLAALLIFLLGFLFLTSEQCPSDYTQQQIESSNCIVGANIGLGLTTMASLGIEFVTIVISVILLVVKRDQKSN